MRPPCAGHSCSAPSASWSSYIHIVYVHGKKEKYVGFYFKMSEITPHSNRMKIVELCNIHVPAGRNVPDIEVLPVSSLSPPSNIWWTWSKGGDHDIIEAGLVWNLEKQSAIPKQTHLPTVPCVLTKTHQVWSQEWTSWNNQISWAACCRVSLLSVFGRTDSSREGRIWCQGLGWSRHQKI